MSAPAAPSRPIAGRLWRGRRRHVGRRCARQGLGSRGVASLEFALTAPILLILMGAGIDFGMLLRVQMVMASGLTNAVQYANVQGSATTAANLRLVMQNATGLNGVTASVAGPGLYCPSGYPVTLTPLVNATTCPGATQPANTYVVITASYPYVPLLPGLSQVIATNVVQTATAMLK